MKFLSAFIVFVGFALSGCDVAPSGQSIRPGVGSEVDLDAAKPPSGVTYRFALSTEGAPFSAEMSLRSRQRSATRYTYTGMMTLTLPDVENLEDISKVVAKTLGKSPVRVKGNQLFVPIGLTADNRFRAVKSNILSDVTEFAPHDCFAVLGACRHTSTDKSGRSVSLLTMTTEEAGVWHAKTKLDPKANNKGIKQSPRHAVFSIDKNAVLIDMVMSRGIGAQRSNFSIRRK